MDMKSRMKKLSVEILSGAEERPRAHHDIELLYVIDGSVTVHVEDRTSRLNAEDILVVNMNKNHWSDEATADLLLAKLVISYQLMSDILETLDIIFWCDSSGGDDERYDNLRAVLKQILTHHLRTEGQVADFTHIILSYQLMDLLAVHFLVRRGDRQIDSGDERYEDRIRQINNYIHANYAMPISMKDLSEKLFLSNGYLSRFFKKNYGMSFADYLTNVRLYHAVDDLLHSTLSITRIAYDNGFASEAVFNKAFKNAYQETPSAFRKRSAAARTGTGDEVRDKEVEERLLYFLATDGAKKKDQPDPDKQSASVSVNSTRKLERIWSNMINIGSARDLLSSEVREHVILLKEGFGIEYVRFWDIFSEPMLLYPTDGAQTYNFSRLDFILDFLVETGVKPHIELGRKPKVIVQTVQRMLLPMQGEAFCPDREVWMNFMEHLMRHLVRRYGQEETDAWRIELWWDERLERNDVCMHHYLEMFEDTYRIVKKYSPALEVGGCGIRFFHPGEEDLVREWVHREVVPDFLSLTAFAYEHGSEYRSMYSKRNTDEGALVHKLDHLRAVLRDEGEPQIKIYITEWNLTISDRNHINDTSFKGAYVIKNILDFYGKADVAGYFTGTDRIAEYYDSAKLLFGGNGILTKDGVVKPAGFAFEFLNYMDPFFLAKGSHYIVTTDGHDCYTIVCHNKRRLNYTYYYVEED